jgi:hypothetical protein
MPKDFKWPATDLNLLLTSKFIIRACIDSNVPVAFFGKF